MKISWYKEHVFCHAPPWHCLFLTPLAKSIWMKILPINSTENNYFQKFSFENSTNTFKNKIDQIWTLLVRERKIIVETSVDEMITTNHVFHIFSMESFSTCYPNVIFIYHCRRHFTMGCCLLCSVVHTCIINIFLKWERYIF